MSGGRGGWHGSAGTVGGLTRTCGLQDHFTKAGPESDPPPVSLSKLRRIIGYFRPYRARWVVIFACVAAVSALQVLPPFCVGLILDRAIPEADLRLLGMLAGAMVGLAVLIGLI